MQWKISRLRVWFSCIFKFDGFNTMLGCFIIFLAAHFLSFPFSLLEENDKSTYSDRRMDALMASYGEASSSDSDSGGSSPVRKRRTISLNDSLDLSKEETVAPSLPPPPVSLLVPPNHIGEAANRVRNFPHVEGNYALHVFIPVHVPQSSKKELALFLKKICNLVPGLHTIETDVALVDVCSSVERFEQMAFGREFHISLGRTVPIRVQQIDSIVSMLRQRLQYSKRYWIDFNRWEIFVNDDHTRTFLSIEVVDRGLREIVKQIAMVNEVYKLHNLPEFYSDPRPHISLAWTAGDTSDSLRKLIEQDAEGSNSCHFHRRHVFSCLQGGVECKIGSKIFKICRFDEDQ